MKQGEAGMPQLWFHNSRTRRRERFTPIDPGHVKLYVCGPTVYDRAHIGNARTFLAYDVLARVLRAHFPRVTYIRNITDVDDKINARALAEGLPIEAITTRTTADFHADMAALGILPPDVEPTATGHIAEMIALIERLIATGHAYAAEGHVLFAVVSFAQYGALSGRDPEELQAGARVEVAPYKRDPGDFVLWKPSDAALPGWDSPWGRGRPGWHIECSAMAWRYLGEDFDLHGGGQDLLFPHHENECAQSLCAFPGSQFAHTWLHSGMLRLNGDKMSKSLGNILTVPALLEKGPAEAVRFAMLGTQYRAELDFTDALLIDAKRTLDRFYRAVDGVEDAAEISALAPFMAALADDLNTPQAIAEMHVLAATALRGERKAAAALKAAGALLGILEWKSQDWLHAKHAALAPGIGDDDIELAKVAREAAKQARDYTRADAIRNALKQRGVVLEDGPTGTKWRRV